MVNKLRKEYLICYDIEDNKVRKKMYTLLLDLGLNNIQKSVFWGFLTRAECNSIYLDAEENLYESDKFLMMPASLKYRENLFLGHTKDEFDDWGTHDSI